MNRRTPDASRSLEALDIREASGLRCFSTAFGSEKQDGSTHTAGAEFNLNRLAGTASPASLHESSSKTPRGFLSFGVVKDITVRRMSAASQVKKLTTK